jgi:AGZA family xanthine/uracil permease-like MFS transporter
MEAVRYYTEALNVYIGSSTFGRIFRLEGCGHVSAMYDEILAHH